jgi:hypothetical protein
MEMTIDPRWSFYLSLSLAVVGFLSGAGSQFTDLGLPAPTVKAILAVCALVMGVGNAVNAVLAAIPSKDSKTGFYLAPKGDPPK